MSNQPKHWDELAIRRKALKDALFERDLLVDLLLACWLCGENLLMVGPPGTAKSLVVETFAQMFGSGSYFRYLLTKFTTPEEIFGPISMKMLEHDKYERVLRNRAGDRKILFLDECFKASSAILNALLTLLNEGLFFNDSKVVKCPTEIVVGASNEYEADDSLYALRDRFLVTAQINGIADDDLWLELLFPSKARTPLPGTISESVADLLRQDVQALGVSPDVKPAVRTIKSALMANGIVLSDRRWKNAMGLVKAWAALSGATEVKVGHLDVLEHVAWRSPEQRPIAASVILTIAAPDREVVRGHYHAIVAKLRDFPYKDLARASTMDADARASLIGAAGQFLAELDDAMAAIMVRVRASQGADAQVMQMAQDAERKIDSATDALNLAQRGRRSSRLSSLAATLTS
jgi:MoxR-like ATPase